MDFKEQLEAGQAYANANENKIKNLVHLVETFVFGISILFGLLGGIAYASVTTKIDLSFLMIIFMLFFCIHFLNCVMKSKPIFSF